MKKMFLLILLLSIATIVFSQEKDSVRVNSFKETKVDKPKSKLSLFAGCGYIFVDGVGGMYDHSSAMLHTLVKYQNTTREDRPFLSIGLDTRIILSGVLYTGPQVGVGISGKHSNLGMYLGRYYKYASSDNKMENKWVDGLGVFLQIKNVRIEISQVEYPQISVLFKLKTS